MFFTNWQSILRTVIMAIGSYTAVVLLLRISGKRTLSKLNAFDYVVTIALGSTLATIILSKDISLAEGLTALTSLILLQYAVTWLSVRSRRFQSLIKNTPRMIYHNGEYLQKEMKKERYTKAEVLQALRSRGYENISEIHTIVVETDGSLSVLGPIQHTHPTTITNLEA